MTGQKWSGSHRRLAEKLKPYALGKPCHFCGTLMLPGQPLDLDHAPDGRYLGVTHARCNRRDGARKGQLVQLARRGQRRRFVMGNEVALGVEIAVDRQHTSVVTAGRDRDGRVAIELTYLDGTYHAGTIASMIGGRPRREILAVILDPRSPSATLVEPLKAFRVDVTEASLSVCAAAHGDFADQLRAGALAIEPHPALTAAAQHAVTRQSAGAEALDRRKPSVDASPIVAAELAVWAVLHVAPSRPPRIYAPVEAP